MQQRTKKQKLWKTQHLKCSCFFLCWHGFCSVHSWVWSTRRMRIKQWFSFCHNYTPSAACEKVLRRISSKMKRQCFCCQLINVFHTSTNRSSAQHNIPKTFYIGKIQTNSECISIYFGGTFFWGHAVVHPPLRKTENNCLCEGLLYFVV
jgi:hypothetical protein